MMTNYISSIRKQFLYYKKLGESTFNQLSDEKLFWSAHVNSNSIAIIVKHLWGNMSSRWTDFLVSDGEKEWRNREGEFEADIITREEMIQKWDAGWTCLFMALDTLNDEILDTPIYIRNMEHTVLEAVNRQLAHYAYHVGQIVYIGKMQTSNWLSLSIPKGESASYNAEKFAKERHREHFTDEWLRNK